MGCFTERGGVAGIGRGRGKVFRPRVRALCLPAILAAGFGGRWRSRGEGVLWKGLSGRFYQSSRSGDTQLISPLVSRYKLCVT
jgi:hypothetical protein